MPSGVIRVGTRASALAMAQARWVTGELTRRHPGLKCILVRVKTQGDAVRDRPLDQLGGLGAFAKELEQALLEGRIDLAVHSLKDLPTQLAPGLTLAAVPARGDPRDALAASPGTTLASLPGGAVVATGSLRRRAQLQRRRPDLDYRPIRGNLPTRLARLADGRAAAVVLAVAGLERLELSRRIAEVLDPAVCLPAVGQGALGVEIRTDDRRLGELTSALDHPPSSQACRAERSFLLRLGGGCSLPVGALARVEGQGLVLEGVVVAPDGGGLVRRAHRGTARDPEGLGEALAEEMLAAGGAEILKGLTA
ncbi:MAG: hydroxymethylbilane synthase [Thermaerobacter sp.]|nr:hydroxymethylbilane synthase [Thermaerobacter sp.]